MRRMTKAGRFMCVVEAADRRPSQVPDGPTNCRSALLAPGGGNLRPGAAALLNPKRSALRLRPVSPQGSKLRRILSAAGLIPAEPNPFNPQRVIDTVPNAAQPIERHHDIFVAISDQITEMRGPRCSSE